MTASDHIIKKFGSMSALADALGHKHPTTVQGWKERGTIPSRQQPLVLRVAQERGIDLTPADFFVEGA